jgi:hypothetical protein
LIFVSLLSSGRRLLPVSFSFFLSLVYPSRSYRMAMFVQILLPS